MTSRRDLLGFTAAGSALAAGGLIAGRPGLAAAETGTQGGAGERTRHYVPNDRGPGTTFQFTVPATAGS